MPILLSLAAAAVALGAAGPDIAPLASKPRATLDLKTAQGASAVDARWQAAEVHLVNASMPAPDAAGKPTGPPQATLAVHPRPGTPDFDAAPWTDLAPGELERRLGPGQASSVWYRLSLRVPESIAGADPTGATLVLDLRIDDYAEVWVNGQLPYHFAQSGGAVVAGWNAPNRLVLTPNARVGERFDIAVFAVNGPISESPTNWVWVRDASLELYAHPRAVGPEAVSAQIHRFDPRAEEIFPRTTTVERVATGFVFTEGPVWDAHDASLLFSDPNENTIYRWRPSGGVETFMRHSGYDGADIAEYRQPGSNGLTFDPEGRLTIDQHGHRRVVRLDPDGALTTLADRYQGMRLNSPNDLVYRSDGSLYFTDPPFGLPRAYDDPRRETPHAGVYRLDGTGLHLLTTDLRGPNGLAFNNKETVLYVGDWDEDHKVVMRYPVVPGGALGPGEVFCDLTREPGEEAIDGVKVDARGNVYVCGPGGLWVFSADGDKLAFLQNPEPPHNIAFGDPDGRTLYMTCHTGLYRVRLGVAGPTP